MLQRALAMTRTGLDDTRRALGALRATPLEDKGLAAATRDLAEGAASRSGLSLKFIVVEPLGSLMPEVEQCYYRVAQEAIENVVKHAQANSLRVSLLREQNLSGTGGLVLEVTDDGRGFSVEALEPEPVYVERRRTGRGYDAVKFGIKGMQERAELIGARLEIESVLGQGTVIRLRRGENT
jgi:signal transduction histidine kinase